MIASKSSSTKFGHSEMLRFFKCLKLFMKHSVDSLQPVMSREYRFALLNCVVNKKSNSCEETCKVE